MLQTALKSAGRITARSSRKPEVRGVARMCCWRRASRQAVDRRLFLAQRPSGHAGYGLIAACTRDETYHADQQSIAWLRRPLRVPYRLLCWRGDPAMISRLGNWWSSWQMRPLRYGHHWDCSILLLMQSPWCLVAKRIKIGVNIAVCNMAFEPRSDIGVCRTLWSGHCGWPCAACTRCGDGNL